MTRQRLQEIVEKWFDEEADSTDAGYNVVTFDQLPSLVGTIMVELHREVNQR